VPELPVEGTATCLVIAFKRLYVNQRGPDEDPYDAMPEMWERRAS